MEAFIERTNEVKKLKFNGTVKSLIKKLLLNPNAVLVSKNGGLLVENDKVSDKDKIKILSVVSGG